MSGSGSAQRRERADGERERPADAFGVVAPAGGRLGFEFRDPFREEPPQASRERPRGRLHRGDGRPRRRLRAFPASGARGPRRRRPPERHAERPQHPVELVSARTLGREDLRHAQTASLVGRSESALLRREILLWRHGLSIRARGAGRGRPPANGTPPVRSPSRRSLVVGVARLLRVRGKPPVPDTVRQRGRCVALQRRAVNAFFPRDRGSQQQARLHHERTTRGAQPRSRPRPLSPRRQIRPIRSSTTTMIRITPRAPLGA